MPNNVIIVPINHENDFLIPQESLFKKFKKRISNSNLVSFFKKCFKQPDVLLNESPQDKYFIPADKIPSDTKILADDFIGSGTFGNVYRVLLNKKYVAVKYLKKGQSLIAFEEERKIMQQLTELNAPFVIKLLGYSQSDFTLSYCIVMEYMQNGSLNEYLHKIKLGKHKDLNWNQKYKIFSQIIEGLAFMHQHHYVHRDVKPANVLLTNKLEARLTDFGLTEKVDDINDIQNDKGTLRYAAPEILNTLPYTTISNLLKSDVYSLGVLMWAICAEKLPYADLDKEKIRDAIVNDEKEPMGIAWPPKLRHVIVWCGKFQPEERPSTKELSYEMKSGIRSFSDRLLELKIKY